MISKFQNNRSSFDDIINPPTSVGGSLIIFVAWRQLLQVTPPAQGDCLKLLKQVDKKRLVEFAKESFDTFDIRFGVLSLTANPKSFPMWTAYSADHTGFCMCKKTATS